MESYLQLIEDPTALNIFTANVKNTTKKRLLNKKYQYITEFDDNKTYEEFSQELDKLYTSEIAKEEKDIINNLLNKSGSKFYQQYKDSQKEQISLLKSLESNEEFGKLDENSQDMFEHTLRFLTGKRIPYSDVAAVTQALLEQDEDGTYIFEKYIENINKGLKEEMQTSFTSIPEAIQTFKDVIKQYIAEEEDRKEMEEEVKTEPVSPKANAPKTEPSVKGPTLEEIVTEKPEPDPDWEEKKAQQKNNEPLAKKFYYRIV